MRQASLKTTPTQAPVAVLHSSESSAPAGESRPDLATPRSAPYQAASVVSPTSAAPAVFPSLGGDEANAVRPTIDGSTGSSAANPASNGPTVFPPLPGTSGLIRPPMGNSRELGRPGTRENSADRLQREQQISKLKARDAEVKAHEMAHLSAAGGYALGGPQYDYQTGPDGQRYAVGGRVQIDVSPVPGDPMATIQKARTIRRAALAPAKPSGQDQRVAARAASMEARAQRQLMEERTGANANRTVESPFSTDAAPDGGSASPNANNRAQQNPFAVQVPNNPFRTAEVPNPFSNRAPASPFGPATPNAQSNFPSTIDASGQRSNSQGLTGPQTPFRATAPAYRPLAPMGQSMPDVGSSNNQPRVAILQDNGDSTNNQPQVATLHSDSAPSRDDVLNARLRAFSVESIGCLNCGNDHNT